MSTQEKRMITVFSTKGKRTKKIETDVTTWGELRELVKKEGYDVEKLHATENINRHDLAHEGAVLPPTPFTLFLRPKKTKSGGKDYNSMGFKELRAELTAEDKTAMSEMFGKNYTRCSTDNLKEYLNGKSGNPAPAKKEEAKPKKEKKGKKGKKNQKTKAESADVEEVSNVADVVASATATNKVDSIVSLLESIIEGSESDDVKTFATNMLDESASLRTAVEEEESPEAAEAQRIADEKAEQKRLEDEANEFMGGF